MGDRKTGKVGRSQAHFIPWTYHRSNGYIYTANSKNNLKTARIDFSQLVGEKATWKRIGGAEMQLETTPTL